MEFNRPIWVEVNLCNLRHNFNEIKGIVKKKKIICVVKADAYGHGAIEVSKTLQEEGAYGFAVASMEEAMNLRESGISLPILVLGYVDPRTLNIASKLNISVTLFDRNFIKRLKEYTGREILNVHINVDTGMGRLGIFPEQTKEVIQALRSFSNIKFEGIYTHFSSADSNREYTIEQLNRFNKVINDLKRYNAIPEIIHAANSAAIINYRNSYFNAVRPGIMLYGVEVKNSFDLRPVMSFKSRIIFSRKVSAGNKISYGGTYITKGEETLATIPVGYADGLPRDISNKEQVLVKGKRATIVGNVTMDLSVINVTGFPYIHPGNEVVIIGEQGSEFIGVEEIASLANTISYEILTRIGKRVKRIYKDFE